MTLSHEQSMWMMRYWNVCLVNRKLINNKCFDFPLLFGSFCCFFCVLDCTYRQHATAQLIYPFYYLLYFNCLLSQFVRFCLEVKILFGSHVIVSIRFVSTSARSESQNGFRKKIVKIRMSLFHTFTTESDLFCVFDPSLSLLITKHVCVTAACLVFDPLADLLL